MRGLILALCLLGIPTAGHGQDAAATARALEADIKGRQVGIKSMQQQRQSLESSRKALQRQRTTLEAERKKVGRADSPDHNSARVSAIDAELTVLREQQARLDRSVAEIKQKLQTASAELRALQKDARAVAAKMRQTQDAQKAEADKKNRDSKKGGGKPEP